MSFWSSVGSWFTGAFTFLQRFIQPALDSLAKNGGEILAQTALDAVRAVAADPKLITDTARRNAAFNAILATLSARGIEAATSAINLALEIAVQNLKAGK